MTKPKPKLKLIRPGGNPNKARPASAFKEGQPRPKNGGRKKGHPNRTTTILKDAILLAAELVGEDGKGKEGLVGYLKGLAMKEKAVYARLLEKVLPLQVAVHSPPQQFTPAEAAEKLRERGLPVPPALLSLASSGTTIANGIGMAVADEYERELGGLDDPDADEPPDDSELTFARGE